MTPQQSAAASKRDAVTDGARYVVAELVDEPVKAAVREALREESVVVQREEPAHTTEVDTARAESGRDGDDSGGPRLGLVLLSVAALGAVYLLRRRDSGTEQSTWSEFEDEGRDGSERGGPEHGGRGPTSGATDPAEAGSDESTASPTADE